MGAYDNADEFGFWENGAIWSLGVPPGVSDNAYIGASAGIRVTVDKSETVGSVGVASNAQLVIDTGALLAATNGSVLYGIDGIVGVATGATFSVGLLLANSGIISVGDTGAANQYGDLALASATVLSGNGTVGLGALTTTGVWTLGEISGVGLTNTGNTIIGAGAIDVTTLDNADGVISTYSQNGPGLQITATTFSNEAVMAVGSDAVMDLGANGDALSLTNDGTIEIGVFDGAGGESPDATLAISGAFTINGTGQIILDSADASIAGDGAVGDSFTNGAQSSIVAEYSSQIGSGADVVNPNYLNFTNDGDVYATGAGVTLRINTGTNLVYDAGGLMEAENGATLILASPVQMGQYYSLLPVPAGGTIEATTGGTVDINSTVVNGPPSGNRFVREASGVVIADSGSTVQIGFGDLVAVPVEIYGSAGWHDGPLPGGVVILLTGGAITGGVTFESAGATLDLVSPVSVVDVSGNGGTVNLSAAQVDISGDDDTVNFTPGPASPVDTATLSNTGEVWDNVYGSNGVVNLDDAISGVVGGGDTVNFTGAGDAASLWNTGGAWDNVLGSDGTVYLNNAISGVVGGGDTVEFSYGTGNAVSLWNDGADWDNVYGSNGTVYLNDAISGVVGGGDTIEFSYAADDAASLWNTGNDWDNVYGSNGWVYLNNAIAGVVGGDDTVEFTYGSGNIASLWNTGSEWDRVYGSNGTVLISDAITGVIGGGDTVEFAYGSGNIASLWNTGGSADTVDNIGSVTGTIYLNNAAATVNGSGDIIDFFTAGADSVTVSGNHETFVLQPLAGAAAITGYDAATDQIDLSAAQFGASWTAFLSKDVSQNASGATVITDPNNSANVLTLVGVSASSLNATNFHFA